MKIPTRRVPSDDCEVFVGRRIVGSEIVDRGQPYRVHEGEWVDVVGVDSVGLYLTYIDLQRYQENSEKLAKDSETTQDEKDKVNTSMAECLRDIVNEVAERVIAWNWTDLTGKTLPPPHGNPDVIRKLSTDELLWLVTAITGETEAERKNALEPSPDISSVEGRSHQKRS